jgi:hypothetical protein
MLRIFALCRSSGLRKTEGIQGEICSATGFQEYVRSSGEAHAARGLDPVERNPRNQDFSDENLCVTFGCFTEMSEFLKRNNQLLLSKSIIPKIF